MPKKKEAALVPERAEWHDTLEELRALTESLPGPTVVNHQGNNAEILTTQGECHLVNLLNNGSISVTRVIMLSGARVAPHSHTNAEVIIVFSGSIQVTIDGERVQLEAGDSLRIPRGVNHSTQASFFAEAIICSIPADTAAPGDGHDE